MKEKKYTTDHEWIELSKDGKIGSPTFRFLRTPRPIERSLMPLYPQAQLEYPSMQRRTSGMLSSLNYPPSTSRYQPVIPWGLLSQSSRRRIS